MDYELLENQILRAMRGNMSQLHISRELGHSYNQFHKWETGQKRFLWSDFLSLCEYKKIPSTEILGKLFGVIFESSEFRDVFPDIEEHVGICNRVFGFLYFDYSTKTLKRWGQGETIPEFSQVLHFLDKIYSVLEGFVSEIVDVQEVPLIKQRFYLKKRQMELYLSRPYAISLHFALSMNQYRDSKIHDENILHELTRLPIDVIRETIKELEACEVILWRNDHYQVIRHGLEMSQFSAKQSAKLGRYFTELSMARFNTHDGVPRGNNKNSLWAYRLAPINSQNAEKVRSILMKALEEISVIISTDQMNCDVDSLKVLNLHYFDLNELHETNN